MDVMNVASGSSAFTAARVQTEVNLSLLSNSMDIAEESMEALLDGLEAAMTGLGQSIDMMA